MPAHPDWDWLTAATATVWSGDVHIGRQLPALLRAAAAHELCGLRFRGTVLDDGLAAELERRALRFLDGQVDQLQRGIDHHGAQRRGREAGQHSVTDHQDNDDRYHRDQRVQLGAASLRVADRGAAAAAADREAVKETDYQVAGGEGAAGEHVVG